MLKLRLDNKIREFLSADSSAVKLAGVMLLGLALILLGSLTTRSDKTTLPVQQTDDERMAEICSQMEGVGECRVFMTYSSDGEDVFAALVLCDGADSVLVREKITSLFTSLYGIGSHRVEIQRLNK